VHTKPCLAIVSLLIALAFILFSQSADADSSSRNALEELTQLYNKANDYFNSLTSYRSITLLEERHGGSIKGTEIVVCIYQKEPFSLYFGWQPGGLYDGLQATYVADRDGPDHFMALETGVRGLIGVKRWHLDSRIICGLYPHHFRMSQYHLGFLLKHVNEIHEKAQALGKIQVTDMGYKNDLIPGKRIKLFEIRLSDDPADGLLYKRSLIGFDETINMPLYIKTYNFDDELQLSYEITEFEPNAKIDPAIFELNKK